MGPVNDEQKAPLYSHAKAFLMPINWEEPFGLVMVESMMSGTPVTAFNRGSIPEVVKDGTEVSGGAKIASTQRSIDLNTTTRG